MFGSVEEIEVAGREEIVQYLEGWGCACYENPSKLKRWSTKTLMLPTWRTTKMTWTDWLTVVVVSPSYAFLLCWLMMSDDHTGDIKSVYRWLTRSKARD